MENKYVLVETISTFRHRYMLRFDELQKLNEEIELNDINAIEWANDTITCEEAEEFSQLHVGELITDTRIIDGDDAMIEMFDRDNDYLREWSRDQKIEYVRKSIQKRVEWQESQTEQNS